MRLSSLVLTTLTALLALGASTIPLDAQVVPSSSLSSSSALRGQLLSSRVVIPQAHSLRSRPGTGLETPPARVEVASVEVGVVVVEQVATTTMDVTLYNPSGSPLEAELLVPVPSGAAVRAFSYQGSATEPTARLLPHEEARGIYDQIVASARDPAILEFLGLHLIRSSVFPVEPRGNQKVRLTYEHLLPADGDRVDYVLPRSESVAYDIPWSVSMKVSSRSPISTVYSPSHHLETIRVSDKQLSLRAGKGTPMQPGSFRVSFLLERGAVTASLLTYPATANDDGYFLLLAGLPATPANRDRALRREVTIVLDRSGSMNGKKLEQVRAAARQVIAGLDDGESFNIVVYNEGVDLFSTRAVVKSPTSVKRAHDYLDRIQARGGTNIHDALLEAMRIEPLENVLPIMLFLTDGLPTIGHTSEISIRDIVSEENQHRRRIFTFGVGVDVNTPLIENIASSTRATTTFVLPDEDVEVKVAGVFRRLGGPVLAAPELDILSSSGEAARDRVQDLFPGTVPDLFEGDQLVLLGRYRGNEPLTFALRGNYLGAPRTFRLDFDLDRATTRNAFVPRLWASRKIAVLIDGIRQLGANTYTSPNVAATSAVTSAAESRLRELVNEVVQLSTEFGILTEYTAFLAQEGTDLAALDNVLIEASRNFKRRAWDCRSGIAGVNQELNVIGQKAQTVLNFSNQFLDATLQKVEITTVQQISDRAFYQKRGRWVDSRIVDREKELKPERVIPFGSDEFRDLASRLASQGRQGCVSLRGDILMLVDGKPVLVKASGTGR